MLRTSEAELQRDDEVLQRTDAERRQLLAHLLEAENAERERMAEGIEDRGFNPGGSGSPEHVVVASMRERATIAGGRLDISNGPADGTTVELWLPGEPPQ